MTLSSLITGRVTDGAGRPVAEAAVSFVAAPGPVPDIAAVTGADGRFALRAPMPGEYVVAATGPGELTGRVTVVVGAAEAPGSGPTGSPSEVEVEIRMERAEP